MTTRLRIPALLMLPLLVISCASTTEPIFVVDGDPVAWHLEVSTNCSRPFPGILAMRAIASEHARAKIEIKECFSKSYTGRSMDEGTEPESPYNNCSAYDPPSYWTESYYIDEELNDIKDLINENTNMVSSTQRIRFLVYSHRWWLNYNFGQNDAITSGGKRLFRIDHMNNAIRGVGVVFVDDLHRYYCLNYKTYEWLTEEIILVALHEMGHVSTEQNDQTAHPNHSGDYNACCALRSPTSNNSACRTIPGYCEQHIRAIADRRDNNDNR